MSTGTTEQDASRGSESSAWAADSLMHVSSGRTDLAGGVASFDERRAPRFLPLSPQDQS